MNWLDLLIVTVVVWGGWTGWRRGLVQELCKTGAAAAALILAVRYAPAWAADLTVYTGLHLPIAQVIAFAALLFGVAGIGYALFPHLQRLLQRVSQVSRLERWAGVLVGVVKSGILVLILIVFAARLPWFAIQDAVGGSTLALLMLDVAPSVYEGVRTLLQRP